ncbi:hypothetical protein [Nonomuraea helvata]|uniref:Uncharacterized protein n=1 Tax=Nonomuraea helvata TaxID=37484 RepID=A0ABV5S8I6_9ACTN
MDLHLVAAALRRDTSDLNLYAGVLLNTLREALPPDCVTVERGRWGLRRVRALAVRLNERVLTLTASDPGLVAVIRHEVRGVMLSRRTVALDTWIEELSRQLIQRAELDAAAAAALRRLVDPQDFG